MKFHTHRVIRVLHTLLFETTRKYSKNDLYLLIDTLRKRGSHGISKIGWPEPSVSFPSP